jgi:hypothetical protein
MKRIPFLAAITLASLAAASTAHADVTETLHTTYQGPLVDTLKQQGRGDVFGQMAEMRMSLTPSRSRLDLGPVDVITDLTAKQVTTLNPAAHTYTQKPYDPATMKNLMVSAFGGAITYKDAVDTGETSQLLGHTVHHYTVHATITLPIQGIPVDKQANDLTMDILATDDLPKTDLDAVQAYNATMGVPKPIKGISLMSRSTYTSGFLSGLVVNSVATAMSTKPIADAVFAIPEGYTKAEPPAVPAPKPAQ